MSKSEQVGCPACGNPDSMVEAAWRPTYQRVTGLTQDGGDGVYGEYETGDDVLVVGWDCSACGWGTNASQTAAEAALKQVMEVASGQLEAAWLTKEAGEEYYTDGRYVYDRSSAHRVLSFVASCESAEKASAVAAALNHAAADA